LGIVSDVRSLKVKGSCKYIKEKFGRLDYVIANAGLGIFKPVDELSAKNGMI
jgi:NADP-dependent 3-hydroxy acid dehydrogenase YdfG